MLMAYAQTFIYTRYITFIAVLKIKTPHNIEGNISFFDKTCFGLILLIACMYDDLRDQHDTDYHNDNHVIKLSMNASMTDDEKKMALTFSISWTFSLRASSPLLMAAACSSARSSWAKNNEYDDS